MVDLIIIGAGPFGISLAAHAKARQLSYLLLGIPMHFWREQMPQSMFIRTNPRYISLSDPDNRFTIDRFGEETGIELNSPFPRPDFVRYAFWFAEQTGIAFTSKLAEQLTYNGEYFTVQTADGTRYEAMQVIIATGLQHFSYIPEVLSALPSHLRSHTFGYKDFQSFAGKKTAVIGGGQSAWEAAALLHLAGSDVELLFRSESVQYAPEDNTASGQRLIDSAEQFYRLPLEQKQERWHTTRRGSVAPFLRPYVDGKVKATGNAAIKRAEAAGDNKVLLTLLGGGTRLLDHVIAATGYRVNLDRLPYLSRELLTSIQREEHFTAFPLLSEQFESSVPGLFFTGPLASHTHGSAYGFIAGVGHASNTIIPYIAKLI